MLGLSYIQEITKDDFSSTLDKPTIRKHNNTLVYIRQINNTA
jgi:hypothetical protein